MKLSVYSLQLLFLFLIFPFSSTVQAQDYRLVNEEEWYLSTYDDIDLYIHEFGRGDTVIVLHGGYGAEHSYLLDFLAPLSPDFHFVTYDQRGSLRSPVPDSSLQQLISPERFIRDLEALRNELGVSRMKIVAHSMGAHLAYSYLQEYPDRVGDLVIISGFIPKFPDQDEMTIMRETQTERAKFLQRSAVSKTLEQIESNENYGPSKKESYLWKVRYASGQIYDLSNWNKVKGGRVFFNKKINPLMSPEKTGTQFNFIPVIKNHPFPVNYLFGYHEFGDYGVKLHRHWLEDAENVTFHIFEDAGHTIWIDKPGEFQSALKQILSQ